VCQREEKAGRDGRPDGAPQVCGERPGRAGAVDRRDEGMAKECVERIAGGVRHAIGRQHERELAAIAHAGDGRAQERIRRKGRRGQRDRAEGAFAAGRKHQAPST
jgi:hypothetical protein